MSKPLKITALLLLLLAGGYGLTQCQNRATAPVVPPLADSPFRPAADARDERVLAAPEVTPEQYAALQQQVVACTPQLQERQQQHEQEREQKLKTALRELLQQGQSLEQLYQELLASSELQPYLQLLFDEAAQQQATQQGFNVLDDSEASYETLFADVVNPQTEPQTEADWLQVLNNLANSSRFYDMALLGHQHQWQNSRVISPGLAFVSNLNTVPLSQARQLVANLNLYPTHIAHAIQQQLPDELIMLLLDRGVELQGMPLFRRLAEDNKAIFNLADAALLAGRANLLPILAQYGIEPSQLNGTVSALDYLISGLTAQNRNRQLNRQCQDNCYQLSAAQIRQLQQLANQGHLLHPLPALSSPYLRLTWLNSRNELASGQWLEPAAEQPNSALVSKLRQLLVVQPVDDATATCLSARQQLRQSRALWSDEQVAAILQQFQQRYSGEALLAALHDYEPALLVALQHRQRQNVEQDIALEETELYLELMRVWRSAERMQQLVFSTPLSPFLTSELLAWVLLQPEYISIWEGRTLPVAPLTMAWFSFASTENWQQLAAGRFDFRLTDQFGMSLYRPAFAHEQAEQVVQLLLEQGVMPQQNRFGPDALHLALDWSFQQGRLFPLLPEILRQPLQVQPTHLSRAKRLQRYYPKLYTELVALAPTLRVSEEHSANLLLALEPN